MQLYIFSLQIYDKESCIQIRQTLTQPMRIEAPIPYIRICLLTRSVQDTQICVLFYFKKKCKNFFKFCHHRPILWIRHLTRSLNDTCQLVFCKYMHNNFVGEKAHPFLIVSLQVNICNTSYYQKSQRHMEVGFLLLD